MIDFASLDQQMESFRASDAAKEEFVRSVLANYKQLLADHNDLRNDVLAEKDTRRRYQDMHKEKQNLISEYQRQFEYSSFVMALIDGDGAIFQDALLQAASGDGGSEAASRLHQALRDHVDSLYSNSSHWPIMVQVYLSLDKLATKLAQVGLIQSPQELRIFAQRFSINQPLFSIIDVGYGKERADHKIKEMLRTFSINPTCRHIIFAGCHDGGYLPNLDYLKHDAAKASQSTLLETTPMHKGFSELTNFRHARFDDVFRSEPLPDILVTNRSHVRSSPPPATTPSTATPVTTEKNDGSWAAVGKSGIPANGTVSITPTGPANKTVSKKKYAYYNKAGQRLDCPLPPKDPAAGLALEARMKRSGKNLCNSWHLGGKCEKGQYCQFEHEPKLTPGQANALRYKSRTLPCKSRYCENVDCFLGHQCSLERDQGYCPHAESCNMRNTHGMDRTKWVRYDRAGNEEILP